MMKRIPLEVLSLKIIDQEYMYTLIKKNERLALQILNTNLNVVNELVNLEGHRGFILGVRGDEALVSVDDKLYLVENGKAEVVLRASKSGNIFWHLAEAEGRVFVQEYGEPPTGIFVSKDLRNWERAITNVDVDKSSRHFHSIAYDPYRRWLIATLGDGCLTRVIVSRDLGSSWEALYRGPWQFVPIVPLRDRIVFGMDSGIARGGIGIYYPDEDRWEFVFLRWHDKGVRHVQMNDLKLLSNGLWIAALGMPRAIVVSKDLRTWYELFVEGFDERFNNYMEVGEGRGFVACSTGRSLLLLEERELENSVNKTRPVMLSYKAYIDRLVGLGFILKRRLPRFHNFIAWHRNDL